MFLDGRDMGIISAIRLGPVVAWIVQFLSKFLYTHHTQIKCGFKKWVCFSSPKLISVAAFVIVGVFTVKWSSL